jgi:AcrR family transcriptional regulator
MGLAHQRKKEPERVRRAILESAAAVAAEQGFKGLSLDAVARAAGITKGGLIHHFPNKQSLLDAICAGLVATLDERMDAQMAGDPVERGRFTRAYVVLALTGSGTAAAARDPWISLCAAAIHIPELQRAWSVWLQVIASPQGSPAPDFTSLLGRLLALASRS